MTEELDMSTIFLVHEIDAGGMNPEVNRGLYYKLLSGGSE